MLAVAHPGPCRLDDDAVIFPAADDVRANTVYRSAMPPLVIQIFSPLRIQLPSAFLTAWVRIEAASEPAPRLGQAEGRQSSPRWPVSAGSVLLFGGAEQQNALHADGTVGTDGEATRNCRENWSGSEPGHIRVRQAEAAVFLGNDQAEQTPDPADLE